MRLLPTGLALAAVLLAAPSSPIAWERGKTSTFATLPAGAPLPEGIEVDGAGNAYVVGLGAGGEGQLIVLDRHGRLVRQVGVSGSSPSLLGLAFHPSTNELLVVDFGAGQVIAVDPLTGASTPFLSPGPLPNPALGVGLNDVTFDRHGNVYVSDSFQGVVWRTGPGGGEAAVWVEDPLLRTTGVPPFGANGLRFDGSESALFVANTGDDTIVRVPVVGGPPGTTGSAGAPAVFANGVNGADGLVIDEDDNVWVAANQADEIVVVDPSGKAIAKLGDFDGIDRDGAAVGLLFPASLRLSGKYLLVTNLALDLRGFSPTFTSVDSAWAAMVTRQTIAAIKIRGR